jgi:hypothetical protein
MPETKMSAMYYGPHHKQFTGKISPQLDTKDKCVKPTFISESDEPKYITIFNG